jgi:hypothetical protein
MTCFNFVCVHNCWLCLKLNGDVYSKGTELPLLGFHFHWAQSSIIKASVHRDPTGLENINSPITVIGLAETSKPTNESHITFQKKEDRIYRDVED